MPRTKVPDKEWKIVLARSGGICAFPSCGTNLTQPGGDDDETAFVGDVAHIVADSRQGPRGDVEMSDADRDKHPNLLLLCPTCHDRVDKQYRTFSVPVLRRIKADHERKIAAAASPGIELDTPQMKEERILSSLLPVTHLPMAVFAAPCGYGDRQDAVIKQYLKYPKDQEQIGKVYRNLRRSFKAASMRFETPTQILLEKTIDTFGTDKTTVHAAQIAWNLFTGMYFKVEGLPWGPTGLAPGTCYIGISFFRPLGDSSSLRTSVVQAFDEKGQGLVLRGHKFMWDEEKYGKSPHLPADQAQQLIDMVLEQYRLENEQRLPQRVVIHKTSRFEPEEQNGFQEALRQVSRIDLVSLCPTSESRLVRTGRYPPMRGTVFHAGDVSYCYTSGYIKGKGYPHGHVPSPLQIADHKGDTARTELLREVLVLTKMNWNSANMFGLMPITLRFSRLVGDILREVPENEKPKAKYKFYM